MWLLAEKWLMARLLAIYYEMAIDDHHRADSNVAVACKESIDDEVFFGGTEKWLGSLKRDMSHGMASNDKISWPLMSAAARLAENQEMLMYGLRKRQTLEIWLLKASWRPGRHRAGERRSNEK